MKLELALELLAASKKSKWAGEESEKRESERGWERVVGYKLASVKKRSYV